MEQVLTNNQLSSAQKSHPSFDHLWMPFTYYKDFIENPPIVIEHGKGMYLYDNEGNRYMDAIGSWWVSFFGHNHPAIVEDLKKQLDQLDHVIMAGFVASPTVKLSHLLQTIMPQGLTRVFYSDDGSTSVEAALKIALQYHHLRGENRRSFVSFDGGYHGDTLGAVSVSNISQFNAIFHDAIRKQLFAKSPYCYRCPLNKSVESCEADCMDSLEQILKEHSSNIAACIFEPLVQGAVGMRIYPPKVLKRIFDLCKHYNVLTIADEVATGFGRTGKLFACDYVNETPDILCCAKGLTGGFLPMAATMVKEEIFEAFQGSFGSGKIFNHGHSFTGNPLGASAACAVIELIHKLNIPESLKPTITHFSRKLKELDRYDCIGDIRTIGLVGALEFVKDKRTKEPLDVSTRFTYRISRNALKHNLLVRPLGDVLYFMPALNITETEISEMFDNFTNALEDTLHE